MTVVYIEAPHVTLSHSFHPRVPHILRQTDSSRILSTKFVASVSMSPVSLFLPYSSMFSSGGLCSAEYLDTSMSCRWTMRHCLCRPRTDTLDNVSRQRSMFLVFVSPQSYKIGEKGETVFTGTLVNSRVAGLCTVQGIKMVLFFLFLLSKGFDW